MHTAIGGVDVDDVCDSLRSENEDSHAHEVLAILYAIHDCTLVGIGRRRLLSRQSPGWHGFMFPLSSAIFVVPKDWHLTGFSSNESVREEGAVHTAWPLP